MLFVNKTPPKHALMLKIMTLNHWLMLINNKMYFKFKKIILQNNKYFDIWKQKWN